MHIHLSVVSAPIGRIVHRFVQAVGVKYLIVAALAAGIFLLSSGAGPKKAATGLPSDVLTSCGVSSPDFASWFQKGRVTRNGIVNPPNSTNTPTSPNCFFYQWAEHMFLWLTSPSPDNYGGNDLVFNSPVFFDVSAVDDTGSRYFIPHIPGHLRAMGLRSAKAGPHNLQVIFNKAGKMLEVEKEHTGPGGRQLILNEKGDSVEVERIVRAPGGKVQFFDKRGQTIKRARPVIRTYAAKSAIVHRFIINKQVFYVNDTDGLEDVEQGQAGTDGVLMTQTGGLVYYVTMVNDMYAYFLTGAKTGGITPMPVQFPVSQADLSNVTGYAATLGQTLTDSLALSVEIKTSWVEVAYLPDTNSHGSYITMSAIIPVYQQLSPGKWVYYGSRQALLALTGMHVVGSIATHPEMIWATFEHMNNGPLDDYQYINNSIQPVLVPKNTTGNWLFCANGGTAPFNRQNMTFNSPYIVADSPLTISPGNTIRRKAWGAAYDVRPNAPDENTAFSNSDIISINNSVRGQLMSGDVRSNYIMTGATWTSDGLAPTGSFPFGNEVGTSMLSNTTMETFQQGSSNKFNSGGTNCFSCHVSNTTGVSHVFDALQPLNTRSSVYRKASR